MLDTIVLSRTAVGRIRAEVCFATKVSRHQLRHVRHELRCRDDLHIAEVGFDLMQEPVRTVRLWLEIGLYAKEYEHSLILSLMLKLLRERLGVSCVVDCSRLKGLALA